MDPSFTDIENTILWAHDERQRSNWLKAFASVVRTAPLDRFRRETLMADLGQAPTEVPDSVLFFSRLSNQQDLDCLALIFQAIFLWHVLEASESLYSHRSSPRPLDRTNESAGGTVPAAALDLAQAANDLELLEELLVELGADNLIPRTHSAIRGVLALLARSQVRDGYWCEAALTRARYLRVWALSPPFFSPDREELSHGDRYAAAVGAMYGDLHFRAHFVHGAALVENVTGTAKPVISCLHCAEKLGSVDVDRFTTDLVSLRYQFSPTEWTTFAREYVAKANHPQADAVIAQIGECVPQCQLGIDDQKLPFADLVCPHWIIRAVAIAIQGKRADAIAQYVRDQLQQKESPAGKQRLMLCGALAFHGVAKSEHTQFVQELVAEYQQALRTRCTQPELQRISHATFCLMKLCDTSKELLTELHERCTILLAEYESQEQSGEDDTSPAPTKKLTETSPIDDSAFARANKLILQAEGHRRNAASADDKEENTTQLLAAQTALREAASLQSPLSAPTRQQRMTFDWASLDLGQVSQHLARQTYDARVITEKPLDSAKHIQEALAAFAAAARADARSDIHVQATAGLSQCFTFICEKHSQERHYATGELDPAFFKWLSAAADAPVNTRRFVVRCAESALHYAVEAIRLAVQRDPPQLSLALDAALNLWSVLRRCQYLPHYLEVHCNAALAEAGNCINSHPLAKLVVDAIRGWKDMLDFIGASCQIDFCRHASDHNSELLCVSKKMNRCAASRHPVVRGVARRHLRWQDIQIEEDGFRANGLHVSGSAAGLVEIRFPNHRRSISIPGASLESSNVAFVHRETIDRQMSNAVAHLEPMLDFDAMPPFVAVGTGILRGDRNIMTSQTPIFRLTTLRIPTPSWDSWLVILETDDPNKLTLNLGVPYLGRFDPEKHDFDASFPGQITAKHQTLSFGETGFSVEILPPDDGITEMMGLLDTMTVKGSREDPVFEFLGTGCRLLFKLAPRETRSETLFLVKDEGADSAQCNLVSAPVSSLSRAMPSALSGSFTPLYFFREKFDDKIERGIVAAEITSLVVVGCPTRRGEISQLLERVYDPNLEIFFIVLQGDESQRLVDDFNQFAEQLADFIGAHALFRSEVPYVGEDDPFSNVQLVSAPRPWAPTAVQMFLDLAHLRRLNIEGLPFLHDGKILRVKTKGNPKGMTRFSTMMRGSCDLEDLMKLYVKHLGGIAKMELNEELYGVPEIGRIAEGRVPKRPLYLLPQYPRECAALAPDVRLRQALPIPNDDWSASFIKELDPDLIISAWSESDMQRLRACVRGTIKSVSTNPLDTCESIVTTGQTQYEEMWNNLQGRFEHLRSQQTLLETMAPSRYAVLATWSAEGAATAIALSNYAAAQGGPIIFLDETSPETTNRVGELLAKIHLHYDQNQRDLGAVGPSSVDVEDVMNELASVLAANAAKAIEILERIAPEFLGIGCSHAIPYELAGAPSLGSRYATGRLTGPNLMSTCELLIQAALGEQIYRESTLQALLIGASGNKFGSPLPSVAGEIETAKIELSRHSFVRVTSIVDDSQDIAVLTRDLPRAEFFHFAGHVVTRSETRGDDLCMVMDGGRFHMTQLPIVLHGRPVVYVNACSSAKMTTMTQVAHNFATEFLGRGAVNFIGNLWPVVDETSAEIAKDTIHQICAGATIGQALNNARNQMSSENRITANALVLFGCPRNRLVNATATLRPGTDGAS